MNTINGLPAHVLLVHAVVVLVPLSAILVILCSLWPAARRRLSLFTFVLSALALISVPLATGAGEWLQHRVQRTTLVRDHTQLGDTMLPWAIGIAVVALIIAGLEFRESRLAVSGPAGAAAVDRPPLPGGRAVPIVVAVLALVVGVGSIITVYAIGESGARASWSTIR